MSRSPFSSRIVALAILLVSAPLGGQVARIVPGPVLDQIPNEEPAPLPRDLTQLERQLPFPALPLAAGPGAPGGPVDTPAEYEQNDGLLMRWGYFNDLITAMTVGITTGDPNATVYIVASSGLIGSATSALTAAGAHMSQVVFLPYTADSVWMRDYGPRFIFDNASRGLVDSFYYPTRPLDDAFPGWLGPQWSEPVYEMLLYHSGGNFHPFGTGDAFMSSIVLDDNPGLTEPDAIGTFLDFHGVDLTVFPHFPYTFDGTGHIDMWVLPVRDDEVIVGEYAPSTGSPYTISENAVSDFLSRGYTVHRVPGWNAGGTHFTYTNAVVFNDIVFVPWYNGYSTQNQQALTVFQTAFPGYQLIQVDCTEIIDYAGAIHCIVQHVPGNPASMTVSPAGGLISSGPVGGPFAPDSISFTIENRLDVPLSYTVGATAPWLTIDPVSGTIPELGSQAISITVNSTALGLAADTYSADVTFTNLTDGSGTTTRAFELRVGTPTLAYSFPLDTDPGWTTTGEWQFGIPLGGGGVPYGEPDPTSGHTGSNVFGVNLAGNYATTVVSPRYLTISPIDCSELSQVELRFWRWLNSDYQPYVGVALEVTHDGTNWTTLWQNGGDEIVESSWTQHSFDISTFADHQSSVQLRWSYWVWNQAYPYSGWNLDDIEIWGVDTSGPLCVDFQRGEINLDGTIDISDPIFLLDHLFSFGDPLGCDDAADVNDDGAINIADVVAVLGYLFGSGAGLPAPGAVCGVDPTADGLGCDTSPTCCP
ncbi:MAG: agmatine deiminase family protein [Planctomycetes bacterium]|nr:agmatine deiminase family protein [Planctomycetota bacterium]